MASCVTAVRWDSGDLGDACPLQNLHIIGAVCTTGKCKMDSISKANSIESEGVSFGFLGTCRSSLIHAEVDYILRYFYVVPSGKMGEDTSKTEESSWLRHIPTLDWNESQTIGERVAENDLLVSRGPLSYHSESTSSRVARLA